MDASTATSSAAGHPRIGLLGGSFDPVHVGHLALGQAAAEALQLDTLIVIPTGESWQKNRSNDAGQTAAAHRLAMVEIAIAPLVRSAARCRWSVDDLEIRRGGPTYTIDTLVALRARQAKECGINGLVCSAEEASSLRGIVGERMSLVTPGIRPAGSDAGDQKRIMTPARAIKAGADYLVVGRPVIASHDPKAVADQIVAEIAQQQG